MSENEKRSYANVKVPARCVTPYEYTAKDGRVFDKAYVHFPEGTKVNGVDLSHYSADTFMTERMKGQLLLGEKVGVGFPTDEPVAVWTGRKDDPERPYKHYEVDPWALVKGVKAAVTAGEQARDRQVQPPTPTTADLMRAAAQAPTAGDGPASGKIDL